jgi:hypothetical protein
MMEYLNVVAIIVAGLMVGSELAIAAFVHPTASVRPPRANWPGGGSTSSQASGATRMPTQSGGLA